MGCINNRTLFTFSSHAAGCQKFLKRKKSDWLPPLLLLVESFDLSGRLVSFWVWHGRPRGRDVSKALIERQPSCSVSICINNCCATSIYSPLLSRCMYDKVRWMGCIRSNDLRYRFNISTLISSGRMSRSAELCNDHKFRTQSCA